MKIPGAALIAAWMRVVIAALAGVCGACSQPPQNHASEGSGGHATTRGTGGASSAGGSGGASGGATGGRGGANGASGSGGASPGSGGVTASDAGASSDAAANGDAGMRDGGAGPLVCGSADEDAVISLSCPTGQIVDHVVFASYGNPSGDSADCASFKTGSCNAATSVSVAHGLCAGRASCMVPATNGAFGDPCSGTVKHASVAVQCVTGTPVQPSQPFKGVANSPCAARTALQVSWYYNWGQTETEPCNDGRGGEFVPMIWGHTGAEQTGSSIASAVATFVARGRGYVLGFNEPDNSSQANIPASTAIMLWPSFDNPAIKLVTPATASNANPGQAWFSDFMTQLNADASLRADVIAIHWYGWGSGSCDASAAGLENYIKWAEAFPGGRPIWITEWGCLNQSAPDENTVVKFYQGALAVFARHPRIERYSWYPWATNCGLVDGNGNLTALGKVYAAAPAYR